MRTTKRFSPSVLARFQREGRGLGTFANYVPWHRVSRGDPSSRGRSHLQMWQGRQRELLSDNEWVALFFACQIVNIIDLIEQFPLSTNAAAHELSRYAADFPRDEHVGTLSLADRLGVKHPVTYGPGERADWVMTTDILLVLRGPSGKPELLAISIKEDEALNNRRTKQLLELEREYWLERGAEWLLITPSLYDERVGLTLRRTMPWAVENPMPDSIIELVTTMAPTFHGRSLTTAQAALAESLGDTELAKYAFWQAVWRGKIRLDLRRGWRPQEPIILLSEEDFAAMNPIASRRSAWT